MNTEAQKNQQCTRLGRYNLSHQGSFQGRHICFARDDQNKTYTCKRRTGAELNHVRRVLVQLGKCNRVLPVLNTVNTGSVLTDSYTFQEQITGSLADVVARKGPVAEMVAARVMRQVLECLAELHSKGVIVQDLELDHFVVTTGSEKIYLHDVVDCDIFDPEADHDAPINPFTAPEVMMTSLHTPQSNIWSSGVMLYVLLSQHWPFFGNNQEELIQSIFSGHYFIHPCWSYELKHLLHCMLSLQPNKRLTAEELIKHPWFNMCTAMETRQKQEQAQTSTNTTSSTTPSAGSSDEHQDNK